MARRPKSTIPRYRRRRARSWPRRILGWIVKLVVGFFLITTLWVLAYRFINPPITATMLGDMLAGRGATRDWMPIGRIDRDMVRAAIAAEDSKFCSHNGFDYQAIENAMQRNASGGRIRGGSTISQLTAKNAFLWQGGGYVRKGLEAWFTVLEEALWPKQRIMEVYLNLAETGIGTYGVNAGSERYFGHDASAMSPTKRRGSPPCCRCPRSAARSLPKDSRGAMAAPSRRGSALWRGMASTPASTRASPRRRTGRRRRARHPRHCLARNMRAPSRCRRSKMWWRSCRQVRTSHCCPSKTRPMSPCRRLRRRRPSASLRRPRNSRHRHSRISFRSNASICDRWRNSDAALPFIG
jgi:monofunctional biosynthetic peptidoglycan transglycosylase